MDTNKPKTNYSILYIFLIIMSIVLVFLYFNENTPSIPDQTKENELLKDPDGGRIPEYITANDIPMQYNHTSEKYEPLNKTKV